jgi:hypothetical protein
MTIACCNLCCTQNLPNHISCCCETIENHHICSQCLGQRIITRCQVEGISLSAVQRCPVAECQAVLRSTLITDTLAAAKQTDALNVYIDTLVRVASGSKVVKEANNTPDPIVVVPDLFTPVTVNLCLLFVVAGAYIALRTTNRNPLGFRTPFQMPKADLTVPLFTHVEAFCSLNFLPIVYSLLIVALHANIQDPNLFYFEFIGKSALMIVFVTVLWFQSVSMYYHVLRYIGNHWFPGLFVICTHNNDPKHTILYMWTVPLMDVLLSEWLPLEYNGWISLFVVNFYEVVYKKEYPPWIARLVTLARRHCRLHKPNVTVAQP